MPSKTDWGSVIFTQRVRETAIPISADFCVSSPVVFSSSILYPEEEFVKKNRSTISYNNANNAKHGSDSL